jgi:hypothetical protein
MIGCSMGLLGRWTLLLVPLLYILGSASIVLLILSLTLWKLDLVKLIDSSPIWLLRTSGLCLYDRLIRFAFLILLVYLKGLDFFFVV